MGVSGLAILLGVHEMGKEAPGGNGDRDGDESGGGDED